MTAFPGFIDLQSGVDKTEAVAQWLEEGAWQLIFRPIGFGKTAWLDLLQAYCDEAAAPYSEERFSGTWIAAHPTVHKNARRVLRLSFQGCSGADGKTVFLERLRAGMRAFFARYPAEASEAALVREEKSPAGLWDVFSRLVQPMGERRLVVLIDDVDGTGDDAAVLSARQREGEAVVDGVLRCDEKCTKPVGDAGFCRRRESLGVVGMVSGRRSFSQCDDGRSVCRAVWKSRTGF